MAPRRRRPRAGRLPLYGIVALVVVDAVLVTVALRPEGLLGDRPAARAAVQVPRPAPTASTGPADTTPAPVPVRRVVAALDGRTAWRVDLGSCASGGAAVAVTADGGASWRRRPSPARAIGRLQPVAADRAFAIAAGARCTAAEYTTTDGARSWEGPRRVVGGWSRTPGRDGTVVTPSRADARPCTGTAAGATTVIDLARVSARSARVLCGDGAVMSSADAGATWRRSASVPGALTLAVRREDAVGRAYAVRRARACDGLEVVRVVSGSARRVACVQAGTVPDGLVSLSVVDDGGWLVVGAATWRSGADLAGWRRVTST